MEEASLDELVMALGSVTSAFETLGKGAWVVKIRASQIRDRELTERRDDTTLEVMARHWQASATGGRWP